MSQCDNISFFGSKLKIIGEATKDVNVFAQLHASDPQYSASQTITNVTSLKQPSYNMTPTLRDAYQSDNWGMINSLEGKASNDIRPIYEMIKEKGIGAWVKVQADDGSLFYLSFSVGGSISSYCSDVVPSTDAQKAADPNALYQATIQIAIFSNTAQIIGVTSFSVGLPTNVVPMSLSLLFAQTISSFISDGLYYNILDFEPRLNANAAQQGLNNCSFKVGEALKGQLAQNINFCIGFIGITTIPGFGLDNAKVHVFNWDPNSDWQILSQAMVNADVPGKDKNPNNLNLSLGKCGDQSFPFPPGFEPSYDVYVDSVILYYLQKNLMHANNSAIQVIRNGDKTQGFSYAYELVRAQDGQVLEGTVVDPQTFLENSKGKYDYRFLTIDTRATSDNIKIIAGVDGNKNNGFNNVCLHINL